MTRSSAPPGGIASYDVSMRPTAERVSSNEARFAAANDAIAYTAAALQPRPFVPFLCECPAPRCSEIAPLSLGEYAALRLFPSRFVVASGCRGGELAGAQIVERNERFTVVDRPID
jgi:hypothetical protein